MRALVQRPPPMDPCDGNRDITSSLLREIPRDEKEGIEVEERKGGELKSPFKLRVTKMV